MAASNTPEPVLSDFEESATNPELEVSIEAEGPSQQELYELKKYERQKDFLGFQHRLACLRTKYPAYFAQESIRKNVAKLQLRLSEETLKALKRPRQ